jgi:hypothetical protein
VNINKHERTIFVDVDETLILHRTYLYGRRPGEYVAYPVSKIAVDDPLDPSKQIWVTPHAAMIRLLKEEHSRGGQIWIWSRGGTQWAVNVIKALKLEDLVYEVMTKPMVYFDDKPVEEWLQHRVYIDPYTIYKGEGGYGRS